MKRRALIAAAFALAACSPPSADPPAGERAQAAATPCSAAASKHWAAGGTDYLVTASSAGASCAEAAATLLIAAADGREVYRADFPAAQVMVLASAHDLPAMQQALAAWIDPDAGSMQTSRDLPEWQDGQAAPVRGEFPFYPEEGVTRARYAAARAANAPMFCFVQGMESEACLMLENGALTKLGVQSFPG